MIYSLTDQLVIGRTATFVCLSEDVFLYERLDVTQCCVLRICFRYAVNN